MTIPILIADDHGVLRAGLRALLSAESDLEVIADADNGIDALKLAEELRPEIVLLDVNMPGMSGIELFARADEIRPGTPKILITGWTESISPAELERLGVRAMLPKPWDDQELKKTLRKVLGAD